MKSEQRARVEDPEQTPLMPFGWRRTITRYEHTASPRFTAQRPNMGESHGGTSLFFYTAVTGKNSLGADQLPSDRIELNSHALVSARLECDSKRLADNSTRRGRGRWFLTVISLNQKVGFRWDCVSNGIRPRFHPDLKSLAVLSAGFQPRLDSAENFIDSKDCAVHLPKGFGEMLFVCHEAPSESPLEFSLIYCRLGPVRAPSTFLRATAAFPADLAE
jgi:hypothetical protein